MKHPQEVQAISRDIPAASLRCAREARGCGTRNGSCRVELLRRCQRAADPPHLLRLEPRERRSRMHGGTRRTGPGCGTDDRGSHSHLLQRRSPRSRCRSRVPRAQSFGEDPARLDEEADDDRPCCHARVAGMGGRRDQYQSVRLNHRDGACESCQAGCLAGTFRTLRPRPTARSPRRSSRLAVVRAALRLA